MEKVLGKYAPTKPGFVRFRNAHAGFAVDGKVYGGNVVCPRTSLIRQHGVSMPADDDRSQFTFALGHLNEQLFENKLIAAKKEYTREHVTIVDIAPTVELIMAVDFNVEGIPYELKACSSTRVYEKIFVKSEYKIENLAQLVNEMVELEAPTGCLRYTNSLYHTNYDVCWSEVKQVARNGSKAKTLEDAVAACKTIAGMVKTKWKAAAGDTKKFLVQITEEGQILVDGVVSVFTLFNLLEHRAITAQCLADDEVWQGRPEDEGPFPACGLCCWKEACDAYDDGSLKTTEEFINFTRDLTKRACV